MDEKVTTIKVTHDTWRELHVRKDPGMSFDDVIQQLLSQENGDQPSNGEEASG